MTEKEMLDYLVSTGLYDKGSETIPYKNLYYEQEMIKSNKTVPIKDLVERFISADKEFNGDSWNIMQILKNIDMIIPVEDREKIKDECNNHSKENYRYCAMCPRCKAIFPFNFVKNDGFIKVSNKPLTLIVKCPSCEGRELCVFLKA